MLYSSNNVIPLFHGKGILSVGAHAMLVQRVEQTSSNSSVTIHNSVLEGNSFVVSNKWSADNSNTRLGIIFISVSINFCLNFIMLFEAFNLFFRRIGQVQHD